MAKRASERMMHEMREGGWREDEIAVRQEADFLAAARTYYSARDRSVRPSEAEFKSEEEIMRK